MAITINYEPPRQKSTNKEKTQNPLEIIAGSGKPYSSKGKVEIYPNKNNIYGLQQMSVEQYNYYVNLLNTRIPKNN